MNNKANRFYTKHLMAEYAVRNDSYFMRQKHIHKEYEIYFLLEGEGTYFIDSLSYPIRKGDLVIIDSMRVHATDFSDCKFHKRLLIELNAQYFEDKILSLSSISLVSFFRNYTGIMSFKNLDYDIFKGILTDIYFETKNKQDNFEHLISIKLAELFIRLSRFSGLTTLSSPDMIKESHVSLVKSAVDYILKNLSDNLSLSKIASHFFVDKSHLSRIFKNVTGMTVHEYININRVKKAQELLENQLPIDDIAKILGFNSTTYFTSVFTKYAAISPYKYRVRQRQIKTTNMLTHV